MLTGPMAGETARISVLGFATLLAAAPIFSVIERVVFGFTTSRRIQAYLGGGGRRML